MDLPYYEKDGRRYDRVTRILSLWPEPELAAWRESVGKAVANRTMKQAQKLGQEFDVLVQGYLETRVVPVRSRKPELYAGFRAFEAWVALNPIQPLHLQVTVYDEVLGIAGTPDCVTRDESLDWKLTNQLKLVNVLQQVLYWPMIEQQHGLTLRLARVVRFDKTLATFEEKILTQAAYEALRPVAVHLIQFYQDWQTLMQLQTSEVTEAHAA